MATHSETRRHGRVRAAGQTDTFFRDHGWTRAPRLVQWMATLRCRLSCEHCLAAGDDAVDMKTSDAARLIEQVADLGVREFLITGGEPLIRPDLPEIIGMLRANRVRWSLNTAVMPDRPTRAAIEQWPPYFAAVSLDGPETIHDSFRGVEGTFRHAMDSIAYFAQLDSCKVAAGTTVTAKNFRHLPATFGLVLQSGADQWGLHLLIPEGRAAHRKNLFLSRSQLKELLRFAAAKRQHFSVTMADEIGYCGLWEPLVRSEPFFCGAGKAQCVVLPDGEVVPCTTLDRSASAGNVLRQSLRDIWENGFEELRSWRPEGKCKSCRYAVACEGGCWLQRRHGTQCFRNVWHMPRAATAAGLAVCLGFAAAAPPVSGPGAGAPGQEIVRPLGPGGVRPGREPRFPDERPAVMSEAEAQALKKQVLQSSIIQWYASQFGDRSDFNAVEIRDNLIKALPDDPGAKYFLQFADNKLPAEIKDRAKLMKEALKTEQRSLCLISLAWRDVTEWCIEGPSPERRTKSERKALRETVEKLGQTADDWRAEIFEEKLDPFLHRPLQDRRFFVSKAGPSLYQSLSGDVAIRQWKGGKDITEEFLANHPYAEHMNLTYTVDKGPKLQCLRSGKRIDADGTLRVFDILLVPAKEVVLTFKGHAQPVSVTLPRDAELTYGDVLRLTYEQNEDLFGQTPFMGLARGPVASAGGPMLQSSPLALPQLLQQKRAFAAKEENAGKPVPREILSPLVDIYLF